MTNLNIDLRLLSNRKAIELTSIRNLKLSEYETRSKEIALNWKYEVVIEALQGLYDLGIAHTCNLSELLDNFEAIGKSER